MQSDSKPHANLLKVYLILHVSVFLYGLSGIFGRIISLEGTILVWYRMVLTITSLLFFPALISKVKAIPRKKFLKIMGIGILLAIHWVAFFDSIRLSNVTIALSCLAASAFFTSIIEPIVFKQKIKLSEIFLGILVIIGFIFMIEYTDESYLLGVILGIFSAFFYATITVGNKAFVAETDGYVLTFIEFIGGALFLSLIMPFYFSAFPEAPRFPTSKDWIFLIALVLLCTTLAYNLTLIAMKRISAYSAALTLNMEPVYAIFMAYLIFREDKELHPGVYLGTGIILLSVFLDLWLKNRAGSSESLAKPQSRKE